MSALPNSIFSVRAKLSDAGLVDFDIQLSGKAASCRIDYGDGKTETMMIPDDLCSERLLSSHKFEKGAFVVTILIRDYNGIAIDKKRLLWGQP